MMAVNVYYMFKKSVFNFLYSTGKAPKCRKTWGSLPTLLSLWMGVGALITR